MLWPMLVGTEPLLRPAMIDDEITFYCQWFDDDVEFFDYWLRDSGVPADAVIRDVLVEGLSLPESPGRALILRSGELHALAFAEKKSGIISVTGCLFHEMRPALKSGGSKLPANAGVVKRIRVLTHDVIARDGEWVRVPDTTVATDVDRIATDLLPEPLIPRSGTDGQVRTVGRGFLTHVEVG